jgi:hypothetical protein
MSIPTSLMARVPLTIRRPGWKTVVTSVWERAEPVMTTRANGAAAAGQLDRQAGLVAAPARARLEHPREWHHRPCVLGRPQAYGGRHLLAGQARAEPDQSVP